MIEAPLDFSSNQSKLLGVNHTDPFANNNSIFDSSSITVGDGSKQISNSVSNSGGSGEGKLDREKLVAFLVQRAQNRNNPITNSMHPNTNINIQTNPGLSTGGDPFVSSSAVDASSQSIPAFDAKYAASYTNNIINGSINIGGGSGGNGMRAGTSANADASSRNTNSGMSAGDRHALVNRLLEERRLATLGGNAQSQQIQPPSGSASSIGDGSSSTNSMNTTPTQMSGAQTLFHAADLSPFQSSMGHLNNKDQLVSPSPLPQRQSSVAAAAEQEKALKDAIFKHTMQQLNNSTGKTQRQVPLATSSMSTSSLAAVAAAARGEGDDNEDIPTSTNYNMTSVDALIHDMSQDNIKKNTRKARKKSAKSSQRAGAQPPAKRNTYVTNTDKMKGNKKKTSSRKDDKYSSNSKNSKRRLKEKGGGSNTLYHAADLESQLISSSSIPSSPKKSMNGHSTHNNDYPTSPYKNQQNLTVTQPFNLTNMVYNRNSKEHVYRALEKELAAQCTFTPTINPSPAQIYSQHNQHQYHKRVERDRRNTNNGSDYDGSGAGDDSAFTDHQRSDGSFTSHSSGWMGSSSNINNANISMHGQDRVSGSMTDSTMTDKGDGPRQHLNYTYNNGNGGGDKESSRERDLNQLSLNVSATYNRSMGGDNMRGRLKEWDRMSRQKRKEKEMRAKEREQELYRECTFKPNINKQRRKRRDSNEYDGAYMAASNNSRTGKVSKKKSQKKKKASKKGGRKGPDVGDYYDKHDGNHHDQQLTAHKSSQSRKEKVNVQAVCDRLHAGMHV